MIVTETCNYIEVDHVSKTYTVDAHTIWAVNDSCAIFREGYLILILGPSGSGKTTLLTLVAGFAGPTSGKIKIFGNDLSRMSSKQLQSFRAEKIGFIFQNFLLLEWLTVEENVALVAEFAEGDGVSPRLKAQRALEKVGILHLAGRNPANLSQGEKQRVAIARASVNSPSLILADEPTASLESKQGFEIIKLLHSMAKQENRCVIVASHDLRLTDFADEIFIIEDGRFRKSDGT